MIKNNKKAAIISSIVILLPIIIGLIFWNELPSVMTTHWGGDGTPNGFSSKAFTVFGMPVILLVFHWVCLLIMESKKRYEQISSNKIIALTYCIIPSISVVMNCLVYYVSLSDGTDQGRAVMTVVNLLLGTMFIVIGNYLPKASQNRYFGIKIYWTLCNKENWNKTHRFSGPVMVACGVLMLAALLLPMKAAAIAMACIVFIGVLLPFVYSYIIYLGHKKQGIVYEPHLNSKKDRIAAIVTAIIICVILAGTALLMFTGDITVSCGDNSVEITSTYYSGIQVFYSEIDEIEYRENYDIGYRTVGFSSAKLSMGNYKNDELGAYRLYAYNACDDCILVRSGEKYLVFNCGTEENTAEVYEIIASKINK